MLKQTMEILAGVIIDETTTYSLQEVCYSCAVNREILQEMIAHGLVEPKQHKSSNWEFDPQAVQRVKIALRLQKDLGVNLAGAALALDLLNELQELRTKLAILERQ